MLYHSFCISQDLYLPKFHWNQLIYHMKLFTKLKSTDYFLHIFLKEIQFLVLSRLLSTFYGLGSFLLTQYFLSLNQEKTYSTVYFYTEIFVQNLILQLLFLILGAVFLYLKFLTSFIICYGWTPLIILFVYKAVFR